MKIMRLRTLLSRWDMVVNAQDRYGNTSLHLAMNEEYIDAYWCRLLENRSDLDVNVFCPMMDSITSRKKYSLEKHNHACGCMPYQDGSQHSDE